MCAECKEMPNSLHSAKSDWLRYPGRREMPARGRTGRRAGLAENAGGTLGDFDGKEAGEEAEDGEEELPAADGGIEVPRILRLERHTYTGLEQGETVYLLSDRRVGFTSEISLEEKLVETAETPSAVVENLLDVL